jgi:hypothetical protein
LLFFSLSAGHKKPFKKKQFKPRSAVQHPVCTPIWRDITAVGCYSLLDGVATIHRPPGCGPSGNESQPLDESFEEEELCEDAPPPRLKSIFIFSLRAHSLSLSCSSSSFVADFLYYVAAICFKKKTSVRSLILCNS